MCGISFFLNAFPNIYLKSLSHRGPDDYQIYENENITLEFHRLSINDLSENGNQPLHVKDCILICNGEIFNHADLSQKYNFETKSKSDCEIIIHLYDHLKTIKSNIYDIISELCDTLDGEFAFILYDIQNKFVIFARDPFGVRPLFFDYESYSFASELKAFKSLSTVKQFPPGNFALLSDFSYLSFLFPYHHTSNTFTFDDLPNILANINSLLRHAVKKRLMSERNLCCLLSGGLDSSLIAAIVASHVPNLKTYSIGFKDSPDLYYAQQVADHIQSDHTNIQLHHDEFINAIDTVIKSIESYDTTTVRASVGNYLVSKYIKENSSNVVVFNGDYADEVCGGYKYFEKCNNPISFNNECKRLVNDICFFDSLRSDRTISAHGLEARVPFADKSFVNYYLSIHPNFRLCNNQIEKYLLRKAFENDKILPDNILWRKKEAFSDGVSNNNNSWSSIIKKYIEPLITDQELKESNFKLKETLYYYKIFSKYYPNATHTIPYLWMPKWCDDTIIDPSARYIS